MQRPWDVLPTEMIHQILRCLFPSLGFRRLRFDYLMYDRDREEIHKANRLSSVLTVSKHWYAALRPLVYGLASFRISTLADMKDVGESVRLCRDIQHLVIDGPLFVIYPHRVHIWLHAMSLQTVKLVFRWGYLPFDGERQREAQVVQATHRYLHTCGMGLSYDLDVQISGPKACGVRGPCGCEDTSAKEIRAFLFGQRFSKIRKVFEMILIPCTHDATVTISAPASTCS